jgi:uncharacterized membrane protein SirB2
MDSASALAYYAPLKSAHIGLAALSIALFLLRNVALLAGAGWTHRRGLRLTVIGIDTALFLAGISLWWMLHLRPDRETWLGIKLLLILAYIVLGALALRRTGTTVARVSALVLALGCIAGVALIATAKDASAPLRLIVGG